MASGGPKTSFSIRSAPLQSEIVHLNAMPVPLGQIASASISAPTANSDAAVPFELVSGMCVHLQADTPGFVGDGPTAAIAKANALAKAKRLDAWEPFSPVLNEDNSAGAVQSVNSEGQTLWFLAYVLQSPGAGILYVGRQK